MFERRGQESPWQEALQCYDRNFPFPSMSVSAMRRSLLRYNLEKVVYGRVENLNRENGTEYAVYAKHKEQEKV